MLEIVSTNKTLLALSNGLKNNPKTDFGIKQGKWSFTVTKNADKAREIIKLFTPSFGLYPLVVKGNGKTFVVYDSDVYLNRKFLSIFGTVPKTTHAGLKLRCTQS